MDKHNHQIVPSARHELARPADTLVMRGLHDLARCAPSGEPPDLTPCTLSYEAADGRAISIIERNTPIPVKRIVMLPVANDQLGSRLSIFQGDWPLAAQNAPLCQVALPRTGAVLQGPVQLEVSFSIDIHGILSIAAREKNTESEAPLKLIVTSSGLSEADIARLREEPYWIKKPLALTLDCGGGVQMELVLIPAGTFNMGSNDGGNDEKPQHTVTISKPFYMGRYQVTQQQWHAVMGNNPSHWKGDNLPVVSGSWDQCQAFCKKLSARTGKAVRLPTEAEWEFACRAGGTGTFCFGDNESELGEYAWFEKNAGEQMHPVGQKKANAWGLYDMHGNVWECCADWFGEYSSSSETDPTGPASGFHGCRVVRGGAFNQNAYNCRSVHRCFGLPSSGGGGFRLVLDPK